MNVMKFSGPCVLTAGLLLAGLSAADKAAPTPAAPTKIMYFDAETLPKGANPDGAVYAFVDSADPAVAAIAQLGYKTIDQVGGMLISEVTRELAAKETSLAVSIMHLKRLELPKPVAGQPTVTAIKRTSLMLRSAANTPDGADQAALDRIHKQLMADESPDKMLVQRITQPGKPVEWRVYRPIAAAQSCLACHGDPKNFAIGVKEALEQQYPEDKAVDYSRQEWRGIIRVSVTPAAGK